MTTPCFTFSLSRMRPNSGRDIDHWFLQSSKIMMFRTVDNICTDEKNIKSNIKFTTMSNKRWLCMTSSVSREERSHLLDHLRVLLHDVQEAIVCCHGSRTLLCWSGHLFEQIGHDVVQTGAAARAHHRIWNTHNVVRSSQCLTHPHWSLVFSWHIMFIFTRHTHRHRQRAWDVQKKNTPHTQVSPTCHYQNEANFSSVKHSLAIITPDVVYWQTERHPVDWDNTMFII